LVDFSVGLKATTKISERKISFTFGGCAVLFSFTIQLL